MPQKKNVYLEQTFKEKGTTKISEVEIANGKGKSGRIIKKGRMQDGTRSKGLDQRGKGEKGHSRVLRPHRISTGREHRGW